jgi:Defence against restriction A C-terminal
MSNKYYLINRPPAYGTHPSGSILTEVWSPTGPIPGGELGDEYQRQAHGYVVYETPLSFAQIWQFELEPDPELLPHIWLVYRYWLEASRSAQDAGWMIQDVWNNSPDSPDNLVDRALLLHKQRGGLLPDLLQLLYEGCGVSH